jgi:hypothetical protein
MQANITKQYEEKIKSLESGTNDLKPRIRDEINSACLDHKTKFEITFQENLNKNNERNSAEFFQIKSSFGMKLD